MLALILAGSLALNDAALAEGGTPRPMNGQTTVRMIDEKIKIKVGEEDTTATCVFTFRNDGRACTIRMGFPDNGYGAADPEEGADNDVMSKPPKSGAMTSFRSWVDGKAIKTQVERGGEAGEYWHTKRVTFRPHALTVVRDTYTLPHSNAIAMFNDHEGSADYAAYVVSTGSSWRGNIGRSEVVFEMPAAVTGVILRTKVTKGDKRNFTVGSFPRGTVVYVGMDKPAVRGRTLSFVRTNWRPGKADDIELWYNLRTGSGLPSAP